MAAPYIHGTSPEEQSRLALMNSILNQRELAEIAPAGHERILEMGAGTGVFARALAEAVPRGSVVGVERDEEQLETARRSAADTANLEVRQGDVYDPPLADEEWGSFDLVHARFLLEHLDRPDEAVSVMVQAARPGGRIVLVDDDHSLMRIWPDSDGFLDVWNAFARQYEVLGQDPIVGRRLVAMLHAAGARPRRVSFLFYGGCSGDPGLSAVVENMAGMIETGRERIVATGEFTAERFDEILAGLREWALGDDRAVWYGLPYAEGIR